VLSYSFSLYSFI